METITSGAAVIGYVAPWISALFALVVAVGCILLGYWLGRNSSDKPWRALNNPASRDQGSGEDPGGDPFAEAMKLRANVDEEAERRPTIRR